MRADVAERARVSMPVAPDSDDLADQVAVVRAPVEFDKDGVPYCPKCGERAVEIPVHHLIGRSEVMYECSLPCGRWVDEEETRW